MCWVLIRLLFFLSIPTGKLNVWWIPTLTFFFFYSKNRMLPRLFSELHCGSILRLCDPPDSLKRKHLHLRKKARVAPLSLWKSRLPFSGFGIETGQMCSALTCLKHHRSLLLNLVTSQSHAGFNVQPHDTFYYFSPGDPVSGNLFYCVRCDY